MCAEIDLTAECGRLTSDKKLSLFCQLEKFKMATKIKMAFKTKINPKNSIFDRLELNCLLIYAGCPTPRESIDHPQISRHRTRILA